jgi:hypothetical protein
MKIKITKCSKPSYWYCNQIGRVFEVLTPEEPHTEDHLVNMDNIPDHRGYIRKEDAMILLDSEFNTLTAIVNQLELCNYITADQLHDLKDNVAFISLKEMARKEGI